MNATKRSAARAGLVVCSVLAVALTGCRTHVVHERTRTVYVPAPAPVVHVPPAPEPPPVVQEAPAPTPPPPAPVVVVSPSPAPVVMIHSENDFYEPLVAHGRWVVVGGYGRCWIPAHVEVGWRPYSNGYWQWTDAGWYWVSEEPWGWATYHYGRWDWHTLHGWIWVPQTQWAPAWVCWREGSGYVGWAPLRPSVTIGVSIGRVDYEPAFASRAFVFVEHRRMLEPVRPRTVIVNNTTIINKTVNITNVKVVNHTVVNEGPPLEAIERASGRRMKAVPAQEFRRKEETVVAARQRTPSQAAERKVPPATRTETRNVTTAALTPISAPVVERPASVNRPAVVAEPTAVSRPAVVEKPAVTTTPTARPIATPTRPTPAKTEAGKAAGVEKATRVEAVKGSATRTATPTETPKAKAEIKPTRAMPTQSAVRPVENPAAVAKPARQPMTTNPGRAAQREEASEKKNAVTPSVVESRPRNEVRLPVKPETKPAVKTTSAAPANVKNQTAAATERPAVQRQNSPREKSRAAEPAQMNNKKPEAKGPKNKGDEQVSPVVPARPNR